MTIGGQTFSVTQAGAPCTFTISPTSSNLTTSAATTGTVTVTAGTGCSWTAVEQRRLDHRHRGRIGQRERQRQL